LRANRELVRAHRYEGRQRLLRRMALGVVKALEVQDASVASASLRALAEVVAKVAYIPGERPADSMDRRGVAAGHDLHCAPVCAPIEV
jgi:hypothetical protein